MENQINPVTGLKEGQKKGREDQDHDQEETRKMNCYYYGCREGTGHYLWDDQGRRLFDHNVPNDFPVKSYALDSGFLPPQQPETQGVASLVHVEGWTILAFWDRSVDTRHGSNSSFVLPGTLTFEEAKELSMLKFPWVWSRLRFPVTRRQTLHEGQR